MTIMCCTVVGHVPIMCCTVLGQATIVCMLYGFRSHDYHALYSLGHVTIMCYIYRDTKKCADKITSLENDITATEAKLEDLKVQYESKSVNTSTLPYIYIYINSG